jgi:uncharacterized protein (TIGR01777 family)
MDILLTGGTGFIGTELCAYLSDQHHKLVVKTRHPERIKGAIRGISSLDQLDGSENFDVVINLAGEPIADKRWSPTQKKRITDSRLSSTQELIDYFTACETKPRLFISGSAIGYYGIDANFESIDEQADGDDSFSSNLCREWEACALQAEPLGIRTCLLRTGIVLGKNGGALNKMVLPFNLGLGGKIGSGTQWMPWIHLHDMVALIAHCITDESLQGPINATAPHPVTNADFTKALGNALHRPTLFTMPAKLIELLMGQMGEELLLAGKRVLPVKIKQAGFQFRYQRLDEALKDIL